MKGGRGASEFSIMKRSILLCLGWLVVTAGLAYAVVAWWVAWNLFSFKMDGDPMGLLGMAGILLALAACWFLARATRDRGSRIVSLVLCILVLGIGLMYLPAEPVTHGFLGRSAPSPIWFRGGLVLASAMPLVFWMRWPFRGWRRTT